MSLQDIYKKAGIVMKPAAMKDGKLYSQQPHSGAGDFNFSRADGVQTRINKHGLIETVADNVPRLSYDLVDGKVSDCPHLLLEPSRENLLVRSEDLSTTWTTSAASITTNTHASPDGNLTADTLEVTGNGGGVYQGSITVTASTQYTFTFYAKRGTIASDETALAIYNQSSSSFIVQNVSYTASETEWTRVTYSFTTPSNCTSVRVYPQRKSSGGLGTTFLWGCQLEAGSYATSYIPTSGSTETRQAEICNGSGNSETFNDSEGVLYAEIESLDNLPSSNGYVSLSDGSSVTNSILIQYRNNGDLRLYNGGTSTAQMIFRDAGVTLTDNLKIAIKYGVSKSEYRVYVNGVSKTVAAAFSETSMSGLDSLHFTYFDSTSSPFEGKCKQLTVFNEALTDAQLQLLTTP